MSRENETLDDGGRITEADDQPTSYGRCDAADPFLDPKVQSALDVLTSHLHKLARERRVEPKRMMKKSARTPLHLVKTRSA